MANSMQHNFNDDKKIVDATKVESPKTARVDTSGIAQALQKIVSDSMPATSAETIHPSKFIADRSAPRIKALYEQYEKLLDVLRHFNGLRATDHLPASLGLEYVELVYRPQQSGPNDESAPAPERRVVLKSVSLVNQVTGLLSPEMGLLLAAIQREIDELNSVTSHIKEHIAQKRARWAEANKDIMITDVTQATEASAPAVTEPEPPKE